MIENIEVVVNKAELVTMGDLPAILEERFNSEMLRWFIARVTGEEIHVECTLFKGEQGMDYHQKVSRVCSGKSVVLSIIPTGVGCSVGGYAADAAPATALLASCCDYLITNPNAVNASNFILKDHNVLYTEGFVIDLFCKGLVHLYRTAANKLGVIINNPAEEELDVAFNIINTVRAVHGVHIEDIVVTEESIGGYCVRNRSGSYVGDIHRPDVLFTACDQLIRKGVTAIAVTSNIENLPLKEYADHFDGKHPNPIGGAEAVISHLICKKYNIPAAHAPLTNIKDMELNRRVVDARGAGEFSSTSGLACILIGLHNAPQFVPATGRRIIDAVDINDVVALVVPADCLGGIPMLYASEQGIPIIAVKGNETILDVTNAALHLKGVYEVSNYAEAAGIIQALKKGISIHSIYRPLSTLRY